MGLAESDIEIVLNKRNIKRFAIIRNDDFVFLDVLYEIIQVLPLNISFNRLTVIKGDCGYFVKLNESQSLIPDSQRRCSVMVPILWMCMNVF